MLDDCTRILYSQGHVLPEASQSWLEPLLYSQEKGNAPGVNSAQNRNHGGQRSIRKNIQARSIRVSSISGSPVIPSAWSCYTSRIYAAIATIDVSFTNNPHDNLPALDNGLELRYILCRAGVVGIIK